MAMAGHDEVLCRLTFGHSTRVAALKALGPPPAFHPAQAGWNHALVARLQAYAAGGYDEFHDVRIALDGLTAFQRRLLECCRRIPYGTTLSYAELATRAGCPRAVRAVGNCMAGNRIPLIVPCHRVIRADGRLGGYSAPGSLRTKRRLLELERRN